MTEIAKLIKEIDRHCAKVQLQPSYICRLAASDGGLYRRLREGGGVTTATVEKIRKFLAGRDRQWDLAWKRARAPKKGRRVKK